MIFFARKIDKYVSVETDANAGASPDGFFSI